MGAFRDLISADLNRPAQATLVGDDGLGVRLHLLNHDDRIAIAGRSTTASAEGRAALILRRRSAEGSGLKTAFVTLMEPIGAGSAIRRAGRIATSPGVVALGVETAEGTEVRVGN